MPKEEDYNLRKSDTTSDVEVAVYLLPVTLSEGDPRFVLPDYNLEFFCKIKHFVVENIRTARRFLKKINKNINIDELSLVELSEHTDYTEIPSMLEPIARGEAIGVMSEAGCPAIADPGARLVELAQQRGIKVIPLVGPSSILLSLMASGFNGQSFTFHGYLPIDERQRDNALRSMSTQIQNKNITQIFIETPYRNNRLMARMLGVLPGHMKLCVASDITGPKQSIITRTVEDWKKTRYDYDKTPTIFLLGK